MQQVSKKLDNQDHMSTSDFTCVVPPLEGYGFKHSEWLSWPCICNAEVHEYIAIVVCLVGEHQHQLAHQLSTNIIGIWEWLNGYGIYCLNNGWSIYGLLG